MAFVVCEPCRDCKYTDCVVVCPMDCFYEDGSMLYIDPLECIDCDACAAECPVDAIFPDTQVPAAWAHFIPLNAERVAALKENGGHLTEKREPVLGPGCRGARADRVGLRDSQNAIGKPFAESFGGNRVVAPTPAEARGYFRPVPRRRRRLPNPQAVRPQDVLRRVLAGRLRRRRICTACRPIAYQSVSVTGQTHDVLAAAAHDAQLFGH